jgi:hypothetical protein
MLTCFISLRTASGNRHSEMSVTDMILGRWELALTDDVYIINGNNSAIFQLYHGENKLVFNEMMMRSALY